MDPDLVPHSSDDEETLVMKENLLRIQLKKKVIAKAASPAKQSSTHVVNPTRPRTPPPKTLQNPFASPKSARSEGLQVLSSPSPRKKQAISISPARVILGIDKGRTGRDVSLRRTPEKPKKSFNQRIAETRADQHVVEKKARQVSVKRVTAFNKVPAFRAQNGDADLDPNTKLQVCDRKVSSENCTNVVNTVSKLLSVHQFYGAVAPPDFEMSQKIEDYIVYGIIASKTTARTTTSGAKYCVLTISDLKTEITMFFYDSAFEKFWTLPLGTLCYFLNPIWQKPAKGSATQLSLKMTDDKGVLEIGKSADFGLCRSIKKDGQQCTRWINSKRQEVCDEHIDLALSKTLNKRIEFASGTRQFDPQERSKRIRIEEQNGIHHSVFFGDNVTTTGGGSMKDYDTIPKDTARLQREADSRAREREVLAKLLKNSAASAGHEYFETTDPNEDTEKDDQSTPRVFNATILRKLGFDPTKKMNGTNVNMHDGELQPRKVDDVDLTVMPGEGTAIMLGLNTATATKDDSDSDLEITY